MSRLDRLPVWAQTQIRDCQRQNVVLRAQLAFLATLTQPCDAREWVRRQLDQPEGDKMPKIKIRERFVVEPLPGRDGSDGRRRQWRVRDTDSGTVVYRGDLGRANLTADHLNREHAWENR